MSDNQLPSDKTNLNATFYNFAGNRNKVYLLNFSFFISPAVNNVSVISFFVE